MQHLSVGARRFLFSILITTSTPEWRSKPRIADRRPKGLKESRHKYVAIHPEKLRQTLCGRHDICLSLTK
jgi:hypothetical protein